MPGKKVQKAPAKRRRRIALAKVTPIVVKSGSSKVATIPVSIQRTGDSPQAEALIPVEVEDRTGKTKQHAARVPIKIRAAAKSQQRRRTRSARSHNLKSRRSHNLAGRAKQKHQPASSGRQQDFIARGLLALTDFEETAVNSAGKVTLGVLDIVPKWLHLGLSVPLELAEKSTEGAQQVYSKASEAVETLYSEASDELESLAA